MMTRIETEQRIKDLKIVQDHIQKARKKLISIYKKDQNSSNVYRDILIELDVQQFALIPEISELEKSIGIETKGMILANF